MTERHIGAGPTAVKVKLYGEYSPTEKRILQYVYIIKGTEDLNNRVKEIRVERMSPDNFDVEIHGTRVVTTKPSSVRVFDDPNALLGGAEVEGNEGRLEQLPGGTSEHQFSATMKLALIREMDWPKWAHLSDYPEMAGDWSGIRDSSPEAIEDIFLAALAELPAHPTSPDVDLGWFDLTNHPDFADNEKKEEPVAQKITTKELRAQANTRKISYHRFMKKAELERAIAYHDGENTDGLALLVEEVSTRVKSYPSTKKRTKSVAPDPMEGVADEPSETTATSADLATPSEGDEPYSLGASGGGIDEPEPQGQRQEAASTLMGQKVEIRGGVEPEKAQFVGRTGTVVDFKPDGDNHHVDRFQVEFVDGERVTVERHELQSI